MEEGGLDVDKFEGGREESVELAARFGVERMSCIDGPEEGAVGEGLQIVVPLIEAFVEAGAVV